MLRCELVDNLDRYLYKRQSCYTAASPPRLPSDNIHQTKCPPLNEVCILNSPKVCHRAADGCGQVLTDHKAKQLPLPTTTIASTGLSNLKRQPRTTNRFERHTSCMQDQNRISKTVDHTMARKLHSQQREGSRLERFCQQTIGLAIAACPATPLVPSSMSHASRKIECRHIRAATT